jgi:anti-sigma factor ChrR (cupin superfamily)
MSGKQRGAEQVQEHEWVALYALGALDTAEKEACEAHLRQCRRCEAELRSLGPVMGAMAESVESAPPADLRRRLLAAVGKAPRKPGVLLQQTGLLISRSAELPWKPLAPGITYKPLFEDSERRYSTLLVRMEAGSHYPGHRHTAIEELFVLSGDLHMEGQVMRSGDYCRADSGSLHGVTSTEAGCMILLMASQTNEMFV